MARVSAQHHLERIPNHFAIRILAAQRALDGTRGRSRTLTGIKHLGSA